ncbi:MAG: hypothetical protein JWR09_5298 [Mucilaginibacter sp.]|nr:hypothetical protein [Mucilaginibacter sp.]
MKKRYLLLLLVLITGFIINSCKKTGQNPIETLFTGGTWQLASIEITQYTGNTQISDTTINDTCSQFFTFKTDFTCTYANFNCQTQPLASGKWSLTPNKLFLIADMVCDSTATLAVKPFINAQIINLGLYSMVLSTGDIAPNYSLTKPRKIVKYGFIRQKLSGSN